MHFDNLLMDKLHWEADIRSRYWKQQVIIKAQIICLREIWWRYNLHTKQLYLMSEMLQTFFFCFSRLWTSKKALNLIMENCFNILTAISCIFFISIEIALLTEMKLHLRIVTDLDWMRWVWIIHFVNKLFWERRAS